MTFITCKCILLFNLFLYNLNFSVSFFIIFVYSFMCCIKTFWIKKRIFPNIVTDYSNVRWGGKRLRERETKKMEGVEKNAKYRFWHNICCFRNLFKEKNIYIYQIKSRRAIFYTQVAHIYLVLSRPCFCLGGKMKTISQSTWKELSFYRNLLAPKSRGYL